MTDTNYDAILIVSFGGPEKKDDVIPFLENVLRGRNVPRERMLEVAEHYNHFDGVSPINQQCRDFIAALEPELRSHGIDLPIYWGNRNWHPMLDDTVQKMADDGVKRAIAFFMSGYSCYSGCRQYRENIIDARAKVGDAAPVIDKIRVFYNHPNFVQTNAELVQNALHEFDEANRSEAHIAFTAHSIPDSMASNSDYEKQLTETARLIAEELNIPDDQWKLVYQSRSGRPQDPWLEPDILDHIDELNSQGVKQLVIAPIGFLSDHMEVMFDLDEEAKEKCDEHGIEMARSATVGVHPDFISMVRELIEERIGQRDEKRCIGQYGPNHDVCPVNCCKPPARPKVAAGRPT